MSVLRTIRFFIYFLGYLIFHQNTLKTAEELRAAGEEEKATQIINENVLRWCKHLLKIAKTEIIVEGKENIPSNQACLFVANHRSYFDIPVMLTCLDTPHGLVAKAESKKIPWIRDWMRALRCIFVHREDPRDGIRAINEAVDQLKNGHSISIFPEGTRYKGEEGGIGEFKGGALKIATKAKVPIVPIAISGARDCMENHHMLITPGKIIFKILPPVETNELSREEQKLLTNTLQEKIHQNLASIKM